MARRRRRPVWSAAGVRALRRQLGLTQQQLADDLDVRQATVSDWERGVYRPRGASARLLTLIAERAGFRYEAERPDEDEGVQPPAGER